MQEKKIPVTYVLFPDEGHGFARPENNLAFYAVTEAFLAEQLGGRCRADRRRLRRLDDHLPRWGRPGARPGRGDCDRTGQRLSTKQSRRQRCWQRRPRRAASAAPCWLVSVSAWSLLAASMAPDVAFDW